MSACRHVRACTHTQRAYICLQARQFVSSHAQTQTRTHTHKRQRAHTPARVHSHTYTIGVLFLCQNGRQQVGRGCSVSWWCIAVRSQRMWWGARQQLDMSCALLYHCQDQTRSLNPHVCVRGGRDVCACDHFCLKRFVLTFINQDLKRIFLDLNRLIDQQ